MRLPWKSGSTRSAKFLGTALSAAAAGYWLPALSSVVPSLRGPFGILDHISDTRRVALTFDDGPHPRGTPAVLEWLADEGALATFFLVGEQVDRWPELAADVAAAGHTIGLHAYRHDFRARIGPWLLSRDLEAAAEIDSRCHGQSSAFLPSTPRDPDDGGCDLGPSTRPGTCSLVKMGQGLGGTLHAAVYRGSGRRQSARR